MAELQPFVGIGDLKLGMSKPQLRHLLDQPFTWLASERDTLFDGWYRPQTDYFNRSKIKVEYDEQDRCTFIEVAANQNVSYKGVPLFALPYQDLLAFIREQDPDLEVNAESFYSPGLGVAATAAENENYYSLPASLLAVFARSDT